MSNLVEIPEDGFSQNEVHFVVFHGLLAVEKSEGHHKGWSHRTTRKRNIVHEIRWPNFCTLLVCACVHDVWVFADKSNTLIIDILLFVRETVSISNQPLKPMR